MERAVCEQCGHWQPADWAPGDLCIACGAAVRREVRCAWCAEWIPAVRYCRACGCEVASPEQYPAARMLKSAGVDRFTLLPRLRELDPEQLANLARIYNAQLAVVSRRVEELRFCEQYLLQKGFAKRLEEELVPTLPLEKEQLASLAAGPQVPPRDDGQALGEIAESSPMAVSRTLASIALLRLGHFKGTFAAASRALASDDPMVALEAALAFAHWRVRLSPYDLWWSAQAYQWGGVSQGIDRRSLAKVAGGVQPGSPLRPWAAAAVALSWFGEYEVLPAEAPAPYDTGPPDWLRAELLAGLTGRDPDLRFTCAMALGEDRIVSSELESVDAQKKVVARRYLAKRSSPAIAPLLVDSPEEIRKEIVNDLQTPLPNPLLEPVLQVALRYPGSLREQCVRLLAPSLDEAMVERLVRLGVAEEDLDVFRILLGAERLPAARDVVRAILKAGLLVPLASYLTDAAQHVDFADEELLRLAGKADSPAVERLVYIAEKQIRDRTSSEDSQVRDAGRFLARVAFSALPGNVREPAWSQLAHGGVWDLFGPAGIRELFGDRKRFIQAILEALAQAEPSELLRSLLDKLSERWTEVAEAFGEERGAINRLVGAVARLAESEERDTISFEAVQLLTTIAIASPAAALPALAALLRSQGDKYKCRDTPARLLTGYDAFAPWLSRDRKPAAELAGALAGMLWSVEAQNLLTRIAITCPAGALPVVLAALRDHGQEYDCPSVSARLLAGYETLAPGLAQDRKLTTELASGLAQALGNETFPSAPWIPVVELLTRLAQDHPAVRKPIAEWVLRHLDDRQYRDEELRVALDALAAALGLAGPAAVGSSGEGKESSPPGTELDHVPILPETPLKTLTEYVAFLKVMGASPNPMAVLAAHGMTQETFVACLSAWGEALAKDDRLAIRYSQLVQP